jgi:hypothetical protein
MGTRSSYSACQMGPSVSCWRWVPLKGRPGDKALLRVCLSDGLSSPGPQNAAACASAVHAVCLRGSVCLTVCPVLGDKALLRVRQKCTLCVSVGLSV